jgi:Flp pilus assembly protein TadG
MIFAIAALPILAGAGLAVDYARAISRRSVLQNGLDGALVALSRDTATLSDAQLKTKIKAYILASHGIQPLGMTLEDPIITRAPPQLGAEISATVETSLMKIVGINQVTIRVGTKASWDTADVILVLDNSATMANNSRLATLRTAVNNFITSVGGTDGTVKIGVMPYGVGVRVPTAYKNRNWILFTGENADVLPDGEDGEDGSPITTSTWTGCLTDRPMNYDTDDTNYKALILSGDPNKKYPAIQTCRTGEGSLRTVFELTSGQSGFTSLASHVSGMTATTNTHANVTIGVAWGHALLSQAIEPFQEASISTATHHRRILILVSSGVNDQSRYSPAAAVGNKFKPSVRAAMACGSLKADPLKIEVYTVNLSFSSTGDTLLSGCASEPRNFFDTTTAADITTAFSKLAQVIRKPRLSH